MAAGLSYYLDQSDVANSALYVWVLALLVAWALFRYLWERWNDEARVRQLVLDWVEWHDRIAYLRFQKSAWETAGQVYESLQAEVRALQDWLVDLHVILTEMDDRVSEQAAALHAEYHRRQREGLPRFLDLGDLESLAGKLDLDAILENTRGQWSPFLQRLIANQDSRPLIAQMTLLIATVM